jgi:hypothetical protein
MEEIINNIFKEKYPKGLSYEFTKEEMTGYMCAINDIKEQLTLTNVVKCVYVVTETDDYGRQLFREVFLDKEQAKEYLAIDNLKEDNINEINEIEFN